ncbi:hypothetical protein BDDG_05464 [Blastomyces dermatitidis ATCC 18188]|uniref:Uncharacterized protein n=1 Tax=Ajellomyces dermatitidis (strain ATCC 18188 / CBS 674.68) TaxID=653446 RepID=F2TH07_AJEDA|nr:hypothetical protein BDDG_05464 [Blastomyces dermatitidis ATCC 18188]EQL30620.1 hypothetical protein BDFG_06888 [Blastomyces dermatitidis ATCC 26199]
MEHQIKQYRLQGRLRCSSMKPGVNDLANGTATVEHPVFEENGVLPRCEENTQSSSKPSQCSGQRESEVEEATVGLVSDFKALEQLTSSSAAVKAKRASNVLDRVLENTHLDVQVGEGSTDNDKGKSKESR